MSKLEKATIEILEGSEKGTRLYVLFNPTEYSLERANTFKATAVPGLGTPLLQFINGEADQLSMDLFLDDFTDTPDPQSPGGPKSVQERVLDISRLLDIDRELHAPPPVRFVWGRFRFDGVVEKLSRKVKIFRPDGTPARVVLSVTFKEFRSLSKQLRNPRRESSDKSKRRVVIGLDNLWTLAAREYNDPAEWPAIAEANDLDDALKISPGDWLILPPLE